MLKYCHYILILLLLSTCTTDQSQKIKLNQEIEEVNLPLGALEQYIGKLTWPVVGSTKISSPFGKRGGRFHTGIDISAPRGTPVLAAHSGRVIVSGHPYSGYGNIIIIEGEKIITFYSHNDVNLVPKGKYVKQGDLIARVGRTGRASGNHLHFEVRSTEYGENYPTFPPLIFFRKK